MSLPAGAVVELHGTYDTDQTSPATIVASGTSTRPVFIRGASASSKPLIRNGWEVGGTYVILENLEFGPLNSSQTGALVMLAPINHAALRGSDLHGNLTDGGLAIESWDSTLNQNVVVINNSIHDNGDVAATYDQDVHGIAVSARVSNLWVLDNQLYRNSGDGIQINAGSAADQATTHNIYVGRNTSYGNKQTGFWAKQAADVIFSQNVCHSHRTSNSSFGQCMGYQYATQRAWFLFNTIYDSEFGIAVASDDGEGTGTDAYFVGNVIYDIHHADASTYNPQTGWSNAGIMLAGGLNHHVIGNTIYDVDAGINVPEGDTGQIDIADNIISSVTVAAANHIFLEGAPTAANAIINHNLLDGDPRVRLGGAQQHLTAAQLSASNSLGTKPLFINPTSDDLHLQSSSPAIDAGETDAIYAAFQKLYGLSILKDADGATRPAGVAIDLGAYEYASGTKGGCGTLAPPPAPANLTATIQGTTLTLEWSEPTGCDQPTSFVTQVGSSSGLSDLGSSSTGSTATSLTAANVPAGVYYVRIKAQNAAGLSAASNEVLATIGSIGTPTSLTGSVSGSTMTLKWKSPTQGIRPTGYQIRVGLTSGANDGSVALPSTSTTWNGANVKPGTYYIRIVATAGTLVSAASNQIVLTVR